MRILNFSVCSDEMVMDNWNFAKVVLDVVDKAKEEVVNKVIKAADDMKGY